MPLLQSEKLRSCELDFDCASDAAASERAFCLVIFAVENGGGLIKHAAELFVIGTFALFNLLAAAIRTPRSGRGSSEEWCPEWYR